MASDCSEPRQAQAENLWDLCARGGNEAVAMTTTQGYLSCRCGVRLRVVIGKGKVFSSKAHTLYEQSTSCTGKDRPATTKGCNTKCWLLWDLAGSIVRHWCRIYFMKSWQLRKKKQPGIFHCNQDTKISAGVEFLGLKFETVINWWGNKNKSIPLIDSWRERYSSLGVTGT